MQDVVSVDTINRLHEDTGVSYDYAGIDEVGVESIAGPMLAAVVVLQPDHGVVGLPIDSKKLMADTVQMMASSIEPAVRFGWIGSLDAEIVDRLGVRKARAMLWQVAAAAVREVLPSVAIVVDGGEAIPGVDNQIAIPGADDTHDAVSAAAILAKARCDRIMVALDAAHPGYLFRKNKGYATREHLLALQRLGPSPVHRREMTQKVIRKGIQSEEIDLRLDELQALLRAVAPILKAHPEIADEWTLGFLREQWVDIIKGGRRPSGRQQYFIVKAYKRIKKAAGKKGLVMEDPIDARRLAPDKPAPSPATPPPGYIARNRPCPCGSGSKYKKCCAPDAVRRKAGQQGGAADGDEKTGR